jgi:hypothetical protein
MPSLECAFTPSEGVVVQLFRSVWLLSDITARPKCNTAEHRYTVLAADKRELNLAPGTPLG